MQINTNLAKGIQVAVKWYCWLGFIILSCSGPCYGTSSLQLTQTSMLESASTDAQSPSFTLLLLLLFLRIPSCRSFGGKFSVKALDIFQILDKLTCGYSCPLIWGTWDSPWTSTSRFLASCLHQALMYHLRNYWLIWGDVACLLVR